MLDARWVTIALFATDWLIRLILIPHVMLRGRSVPVTLAWVAFVAALPLPALIVYGLVGGPAIGQRRRARFQALRAAAETRLQPAIASGAPAPAPLTGAAARVASVTTALVKLPPTGGNALRLLSDADDTLRALAADIDSATTHVNMLYYIWIADGLSTLVGDALVRAAARGVECRVLVDDLGSAAFLKSREITRLRDAGVRVASALPVSAWRALFFRRADLRNHRKITVIDGTVAYVGSQNLADAVFGKPRTIRRRLGHWLDATIRIDGPAAIGLQAALLTDWDAEHPGELGDPARFFPSAARTPRGPCAVQIVPSGPGQSPEAVQHGFLALMFAAEREIVLTTPYCVPDEALLAAFRHAILRGVSVTIVVPQTHDLPVTAAAARAHYTDLLNAGVRIMYHRGGLLHTKTATIDGEVAMIGSANLDMRSFHLNLEVSAFVFNAAFTAELRALQDRYCAESAPLALASWRRRSLFRRLPEAAARLLSPLL